MAAPLQLEFLDDQLVAFFRFSAGLRNLNLFLAGQILPRQAVFVGHSYGMFDNILKLSNVSRIMMSQ